MVRRGVRIRRGGTPKVITFKANWMVNTTTFENAADGAYCFMRYGYRPYQSVVNCQENPVTNDAGYYPSVYAAIAQQDFYSVTHREEVVTLADLYKWATLKRVTWSVRPKLQVQDRVAQLAGSNTTVAWTATSRDILMRAVRPIIYYSICHVERNPRNTDNVNNNIAGVNTTIMDNTTTRRPVIAWPDEGADAYLSSGTIAAGSQDFNYFHNMRMIKRANTNRGFRATWRPFGGYSSQFIEQGYCKKIELRALQNLVNGVVDDTVIGTGVEDDFCCGGLWMAVPVVGFCSTLEIGTPATTNTAITHYLVGCNATYSFYGRY